MSSITKIDKAETAKYEKFSIVKLEKEENAFMVVDIKSDRDVLLYHLQSLEDLNRHSWSAPFFVREKEIVNFEDNLIWCIRISGDFPKVMEGLFDAEVLDGYRVLSATQENFKNIWREYLDDKKGFEAEIVQIQTEKHGRIFRHSEGLSA